MKNLRTLVLLSIGFLLIGLLVFTNIPSNGTAPDNGLLAFLRGYEGSFSHIIILHALAALYVIERSEKQSRFRFSAITLSSSVCLHVACFLTLNILRYADLNANALMNIVLSVIVLGYILGWLSAAWAAWRD